MNSTKLFLQQLKPQHFWDVDLADWPVIIKDPDLSWEVIKKELDKKVLAFVVR